jgi:phytanoyl-CoA hydroxylase
MTCAYMPDGSTFNGKQNVLPMPYFKTLAVGDVLKDDWINPLICHRDKSRVLSKAKIPAAMAKI